MTDQLSTQTAGAPSALVTSAVHAATVFNPEIFESLHKVAVLMASSSLVPDTLVKKDGKLLTIEERTANCFLVVEQSHRWAMSPFAAVACASVVHGRLMWEGKLINAVIEAQMGVRLTYTFNGQTGDALGVVVSGTRSGETEAVTVSGTVGDWKTTGNGSPWKGESANERQLRYRGAREWGRAYAASAILGIIAEDEAQDFKKEAKNVTESYVRETPLDVAPAKQIAAAPAAGVAVYVMDVTVKESAPGAKKPWKAYVVTLASDGKQFDVGTMDGAIGEFAKSLQGQEAIADYEETDKGLILHSIQSQEEGIA